MLLEKGKVSEDALKLIVKISEGSVRDSLSLLDRALITQSIEQKELNLQDAQKIFGYFNKLHLIEIIKLTLEGKESEVLLKFRKISDLGIDPKAFLNDFLEIIYFMKNIKIFDKNEINFYLSDSESKLIEELSKQVDTETLVMYWQFALKALEELNIVSNQNLLIEMFLIRLIYLKKIPKLEELLTKFEEQKDEGVSSRIVEKPLNKPEESKKDFINEDKKTTNQMKNIKKQFTKKLQILIL